MNSLRPPWTALSIVALIAILGCFFRISIAASELLWLDELHTSWSVRGSFSEVASRAADGNQSPFYFWLTWMITSVFGHSELSIRSVSIIAGIGTILGAGWFTWRWTRSEDAALIVAWLIAIDVQFVNYGCEARPYALLQLLSVIQLSLFCEAFWHRDSNTQPPELARGRGNWPYGWLAFVSLLLIYTHSTSAWLFVAEAIFVGVAWLASLIGRLVSKQPPTDRGNPRFRLISTTLIVAVCCLPILAQLTAVYDRRGNWEAISSISQLSSESLVVAISLIGLPAVYLFLGRIIETWIGRVKKTSGEISRLAMVLLCAVVPIGCVAGMEYFRIAPLALQRYTLVGAIGFPIFAGLCLGCLATKPARLGLASVIFAATLFPNPIFQSIIRQRDIPQFRIEDWGTPISEINATESKSRQPVFLFANLIEDRDALVDKDTRFQNYLLFPVYGLYRIDDEDRQVSAGPTLELTHFDEEQIKSIQSRSGAWVIVRSDQELLVEEIVNEFRFRAAMELGKQPNEIRVSILEKTPNSPVYLMSVDW